MVAPVAEMRGVEVRWGSRAVLDGVDLVLQPGERKGGQPPTVEAAYLRGSMGR